MGRIKNCITGGCCIALMVAALTGLLLLLVSVAVVFWGSTPLDRAILAEFATLRAPLADTLWRWITWLGSFYLLGPGVAVFVFLLARAGRRGDARLLGVGFYGAALTTWVIKRVVGRERPVLYETLLASPPTDPAFPSGHTTHALAVALLVIWLIRHLRTTVRGVVAPLLLVTALLVALSRLYLQLHWPSDLLGGALVALFWSAIAVFFTGSCHRGR